MQSKLYRFANVIVFSILVFACTDSDSLLIDGDFDNAEGEQVVSDGDLEADLETDLEAAEAEAELEIEFNIDELDLLQYVDPMIGTHGSGNVVPGASMPHGMVKLSPDTNAKAGSIDAYEYGDDKIDGFSHTHLEGPGGSANGYSQVLFMPSLGEVKIDRENYASTYSHESEEASPGYYAVTLLDYDIRAELTAGKRAGFHRYTFPESDTSHVLVDLGYSRGDPIDGLFEVVDNTTIQGFGTYSVHPMLNFLLGGDDNFSLSTVYFYAVFDMEFSSYGTWAKGESEALKPGSGKQNGKDIGGYVQFATTKGEAVEVRVGISFIDIEHAKLNLEADIGELSFEEVQTKTEQTWNSLLNRVQVEGGTDTDKKIFYTALYHSMLQPADSTEAGGDFYTAAAGVDSMSRADGWRYFTDDWCMWDTFRTSHPLGTILEPEIRSDIVRSMLHWYEEGGWLPKCTWHAGGYSGVMIGNHAVPIIVDAYVKGLQNFDADLAYEAIKKAALEDNENIGSKTMCGYFNRGTVPSYIELGYVPSECDGTQSVSMTLEYAYNDWCTAIMAKELGHEEDYQAFMKRSQNFRNNWNASNGFMQGRHENGDWLEPFDPESTADFNQFCEGSSWIYSWFVPHAVPDLIEMMGGKSAFVDRLDTYFASDYHDPSNQPGFHVPFLYHFADKPEKSQERVLSLLQESFSSKPNGLPGNDDSGAMSAWYVLSALGLYPIAPGDTTYQITLPLFDSITINLHPKFYPGKTFTIKRISDTEFAATYNDQALPNMSITHQQITEGGVLKVSDGLGVK